MNKVQDICWFLLVMLVPLFVNLWGQQPFALPKVMLMRTLVWLLAGLALVDAILNRRSLRHFLSQNPLLAPAGLLALVILVTTATAVNPLLSLWGSHARNQGAVTLLTYLLLFLVAADQLRSAARARSVIAAMAAAAAPLVLFSLLQQTGWNPFPLTSDARSPIYATLGRANFVGAYLAILSPLTLGLLLTAPDRARRRGWALLFAGEILVIGLTLARGAWLATAVALSLFTLLWWGGGLTRRGRRLLQGSIVLLVASGPLAVLWLGRSGAGSSAARLAIWQGVAQLIRQRPLLGYGADALEVMFQRVYVPELVYYQGREFFVDRAHNLFLDWLVTAGIPGLLAWLLLLGTFFFHMHREFSRSPSPQKRLLLSGAVAAILGNITHNLVSFDVTPTATATWLLLGIGVALARSAPLMAGYDGGKRPWRRWALAGLIFTVIGMVAWQANGRPLLADVAARSAHRHLQQGNGAGGIAAAERAVAYWPAADHYLLLSRAYARQARVDAAAAPDRLASAATALRAARALRPGDAMLWLHTGEFYTLAARQSGSDTRETADAAYRQAAALAPNHAVIYTAWGRARLEAGSAERAAPLLRRAVQLDASSGEAYRYLSEAELALGRLEIALADYKEAVRLWPQSGPAYAGLARTYWRLGRFDEALLAAGAALQHDPGNEQAKFIRQVILETP